jgi:long-subunit acyl-CoA synthetase (AMP-forming)
VDERNAVVPPGLAAATLCEAFQSTAAASGGGTALRDSDGGAELDWTEYAERVRRVAAGLAALGIRRGDTVGMLLCNRPEFQLLDCAALHLGAIPFSIYPTSAPEQVDYLLGNADNRVLVTERRLRPRLRACETTVEHLIVLDGDPDEGIDLSRLEAAGAADFDFEAAWRAVRPEDVATLIYTSGTTGPPKGVELTHANVVFATRASHELGGLHAGDSLVSYLPHAHMVDRLFAHYFHLVAGGTVTTVADSTRLFEALPRCRPSVFIGVPRVWEKLHAALLAGFQAEPAERRAAIEAAVAVGLEKVRAEQAGERVPAATQRAWEQADTEIFAALRARLGLDRAHWVLTGSVAFPRAVHEFFCAIGLPIVEGWGMSETTALGAINEIGNVRIGSVGRALPGSELKLEADGELVIRGPQVMRGYRRDPERTAAALAPDGWLRTGDVGRFDPEGRLQIVDRKKELIINAAGKNMSPANIEEKLKSASPWIGQACCIGDGRAYNVALIVLDRDICAAHLAARGLDPAAASDLGEDAEVIAAVETAIEGANARLARIEQIKRYALLTDEWLPDGEELTPTLKLKRRAIVAKYGDTIEALYSGREK